MNVNYNFLVKLYSELNNDQKLNLIKTYIYNQVVNQLSGYFKSRLIVDFLAPRAGLEPATN